MGSAPRPESLGVKPASISLVWNTSLATTNATLAGNISAETTATAAAAPLGARAAGGGLPPRDPGRRANSAVIDKLSRHQPACGQTRSGAGCRPGHERAAASGSGQTHRVNAGPRGHERACAEASRACSRRRRGYERALPRAEARGRDSGDAGITAVGTRHQRAGARPAARATAQS
jgi:hypothetical protein